MKADLKKAVVGYTARRGRFDVLEIPPLSYLTIDGEGDPNTSPSYADALAALYPVAYNLKFFSARELDRDYGVMPLQARWWADDPTLFTTARDKGRWKWSVMILVPGWLDAGHVETAREGARRRRASPALDLLRLVTVREGLVVQTLHVGPYDDEGPLLARLHDEVIPARGLRPTLPHHEIYLSDPRRAAPERLRTILRQPVEPVV